MWLVLTSKSAKADALAKAHKHAISILSIRKSDVCLSVIRFFCARCCGVCEPNADVAFLKPNAKVELFQGSPVVATLSGLLCECGEFRENLASRMADFRCRYTKRTLSFCVNETDAGFVVVAIEAKTLPHSNDAQGTIYLLAAKIIGCSVFVTL